VSRGGLMRTYEPNLIFSIDLLYPFVEELYTAGRTREASYMLRGTKRTT
jgi:hypothetical protein